MQPDMNNPYDAHAVFAMSFICDRCGKQLPEPPLNTGERDDDWFLALARKAEAEGWFVPPKEADGKMNVMFCLSPECVKYKDEELAKTTWEKI